MKSQTEHATAESSENLYVADNLHRQNADNVQTIRLSELYPFRDHPFKVVDDDKMQETVDSIREYGVLVPIIARPKEDGGYEIISGHRRCHASEIAGLETVPVIVRHLDDDEATIIMIDSNLQRENLLPSERAKAYKMMLDAIKRQGQRSDLTSTQFAQKLSVEKIGEDAGVSKDTIRNWIKNTDMPAHKLGRLWKFKKSEIDKWISEKDKKLENYHAIRISEMIKSLISTHTWAVFIESFNIETP